MDRQHRRLAEECSEIRARLAETEQHVEQLQNTLCGLAREATDLSVRHPCRKCKASLMLARNGQIYCPNCRYGRTV